jgi:hypothetical protein
MKRNLSVSLTILFLGTTLNLSAKKADSITQYGITWNFNAPVEIGQFVTGDYYVVGPCTITSITPMPGDGRNGSELNPALNDSKSGYDSRVEGGRYDSRNRTKR